MSARTRLPLPLRKSIDHANARCDHCIGTTVHIAVVVGSCSASDFGTSSPTIIAERREDQEDDDRGRRSRGFWIESGDAFDEWRETRRDGRLGVGAEDQAGEGDANLRCGNVVIEGMGVSTGRTRSESATVFCQPP